MSRTSYRVNLSKAKNDGEALWICVKCLMRHKYSPKTISLFINEATSKDSEHLYNTCKEWFICKCE